MHIKQRVLVSLLLLTGLMGCNGSSESSNRTSERDALFAKKEHLINEIAEDISGLEEATDEAMRRKTFREAKRDFSEVCNLAESGQTRDMVAMAVLEGPERVLLYSWIVEGNEEVAKCMIQAVKEECPGEEEKINRLFDKIRELIKISQKIRALPISK